MRLRIDLNEPRIMSKCTNDKFGKFAASEWRRLINPYTPRDTGQLMQNVSILPFKIHYKVPYATRVYYGKNMSFRKKNPYSTYEWDKAAEKAGQKEKLYRTLNAALRSGRF